MKDLWNLHWYRLGAMINCIQSLRAGSNFWRLLWTLLGGLHGTCDRRRIEDGEMVTLGLKKWLLVATEVIKDCRSVMRSRKNPLMWALWKPLLCDSGSSSYFTIYIICSLYCYSTAPRGLCLLLSTVVC